MSYPGRVDAIDETAAVLDSLRDVWDEVAVDERDHALQCGYLAVHAGADDDVVLAAVLHDVAHSPLLGPVDDYHHDRAAQAWLTPRFGPRVGWLAGAHVAAKRYLAATDATYAATLSAVSVASLQHQGGAAVDPEMIRHPWWDDALRLRRFDDGAKVVGGPALSIDEVLALARLISGTP